MVNGEWMNEWMNVWLQTGEIYYINWRNGMKAKEDPRRMGGEYYSEDESWYDSEESSSESCPSSSKEHSYNSNNQVEKQNNVLVVAGCKSCLMYFMVPKQVEDCPKCSGQLLHFDRSENASSSPWLLLNLISCSHSVILSLFLFVLIMETKLFFFSTQSPFNVWDLQRCPCGFSFQ